MTYITYCFIGWLSPLVAVCVISISIVSSILILILPTVLHCTVYTVAKALAAEQCRVVLADTNLDSIQQVQQGFWKSAQAQHQQQQQLQHQSRTTVTTTPSLCVECNVTKEAQVASLLQQADDFAATTTANNNDNNNNNNNGSMKNDDDERPTSKAAESSATLLVNCAGITRDNWVGTMSLDDWNSVLDVNLTGTFLTCRAFLHQERLKRLLVLDNHHHNTPSAPQLAIVNVGSIVSELGNWGQANYAASKGGVLGLTRALAKEAASRNVRVNAIVPGFIDTPMAQAVPDHVREQLLPKIPLGRFGQPEEVSNLVQFLLSPRSSYITGESIVVSGMISL
jgi:NAD(P)-dependent dehydrogenase (short-subunit alcohol dehydrogenase family)